MFNRKSLLLAWPLPSPPAAALAAKKGDPDKGKEVFQQCTPCHNADSTEKKMGPGLKGLFSKEKLNNGKKPTEENVRPRSTKAATACRPTKRCWATTKRPISSLT
jgi:mono/diheme cytochrome c family protein